MRIKNTHMRIKFLLSLVCSILSFTEHAYRMHAYFRMRFFYAGQGIKYGHGMRIFQEFIKKFFCGLTSQGFLV